MEKYLLLEAKKENWGLMVYGDWRSISWKVYSDGSYAVRIGFVSDYGKDDFIQKTGRMRKGHFSRLCEAIDQDWSSEIDSCACDGVAWEIVQYSPDGTVVKSSGKLGKQKGEIYVVRGVVNKQTDNASTMTIYIEKTNLLYAGN